MMKRINLFISISLAIIYFLLAPAVQAHETLPSGFQKETVASGLSQTTALTQAPDGRIFVLEKTGSVRIVSNDQLLASPLITLPVETTVERGLLGIALDPNFSSNHYMYLYYTHANPLENRVSRFTVNGNTADSASEKILVKSEQPIGKDHHAGTLRFGPDGKLWISVGNNDDGNNAKSQDLSNIHGKILRINSDGSIPADNPFVGQAGKKGEIWAYGFRNPFRFNFYGSQPIVGDVGNANVEEVNLIQKGGNYGWPLAEGACSSACPYINPIFTYNHAGADASITGGLVYSANSGQYAFPASYVGTYFYGDYARGFINTFEIHDGSVTQESTFDHEAGTVVDFMQAPDGSLYYVTIYDPPNYGSSGKLMRLRYDTTAAQTPVAVIKNDPSAGPAPLTVNFTGSESSDPNGKPLTYLWNFGDGTTSTEANPVHVYTQNGTYTASLTVNNGTQSASIISFPIGVGIVLPQVTITSPTDKGKYNAGQTVTYGATAKDKNGNDIPASAFSWVITFHHGEHTHPFLGPVTGVKTGSFVTNDVGEQSTNTWYEVALTVTDISGYSTTVRNNIYPNLTTITFAARPADTGLAFTLNGNPQTFPTTVKSVVGFKWAVDMPNRQTVGINNYDFLYWSDTGDRTHTIVAPATDTTYTANLTKNEVGKGSVRFRVREIDTDGNWTGKFINDATAKLTEVGTGNTTYEATTSATLGSDEGWVMFDNIEAGSYGALAFKEGYVGMWKQTDCDAGSTTTNATLKNGNTNNLPAGWQSTITVLANRTTWCIDVGLKRTTQGNLAFRMRSIVKNTDDLGNPVYTGTGFINNVTVKLTDVTGTTVYKTTTSATVNGGDGWVIFSDIPEGMYGVLGYKTDLTGMWRQIDCSQGYDVKNASITNANTAGNVAAFDNNVKIIGGITNYCHDLGFMAQSGQIRLRVRDINARNVPSGTFINGATAKLTDTNMTVVAQATISSVQNGGDGWVAFDNIPAGDYAIIVDKIGYKGSWRQTDCEAGGTTQGVSVQNNLTDGQIAGSQKLIRVEVGKTTWCSDIGLQSSALPTVGDIHFRVREFDGNGNFTGSFINGATAKLTDTAGNTVFATQTSKIVNGGDGWIFFDDVDTSKQYGIIVQKSGMSGVWKQTDCGAGGTTTSASLQNSNTDNLVAAFQSPVGVAANSTTFCKDVGLKSGSAATASIKLRIREVDDAGNFTGTFLNGVTVKLTDTAGTTVLKTITSQTQNTDQEGWAYITGVASGSYGVMAYKTGFTGLWKQTDCGAGGSTTGATIQNTNTEGLTAGWQGSVAVTTGTTWCADIGLKNLSAQPKGSLSLRIRQFTGGGNFTGTFVTGATVKVTDTAGTTVIASKTTDADGWVHFTNIPVGSYGVMAYMKDFQGYWKQTDCGAGGTTTDATIQNTTSENTLAAWQSNVPITANQTTWCMDMGLKNGTISAQSMSAPTPTTTEILSPTIASNSGEVK